MYEIEIDGQLVEYVEIELNEGHFTSMLKSTYDEVTAAQAAQPHTPLGVNE